jgi:murein DD-endopeptidase MepM/ murein hydrolase activator NlpD
MKQHYFIVVLAHSFHGRLRRLHIPHQAVWGVLALALVGAVSVAGMVSSYARMALKVANYNSLQNQMETLRERYSQLEKSASATNEQLATLQLFATEVSMAYGIKRKDAGAAGLAAEGPLMPTFNESLKDYNFLKSANFSRSFRRYARLYQTNVRPTLWPTHGTLLSSFGRRTDPFSGEGSFHSGVDISAPTGTPIRATGDGIVLHAEWSGAYGRLVVIDHGGGMHTYYAHLSRADVIAGQDIRRGQILGASGATGRVTAPHLHYEVRQNGTPINPYIFLARSTAAAAPGSVKKDLPF